ncbi:MAG TPA: bifunctional pyr operon transcriptional regulator/uracil phosphoribosyltransferase PyrR [Terriglobia bacterium]|nr:bifunctional pyr operon transcriptional regulator/uracil phosphoribosyltransferase PyrR [Terriglobia bacterium]
MPIREKAHLMTGSEIERTLVHLAHEIVDRTESVQNLVFIGVRRRGIYLAERLARKIGQMTSTAVPVGGIDIQQYRDDLTLRQMDPAVQGKQIPFPIAGRDVVLVDDVLYTGRTARAALEALFDHGRPRRIRLCVLIDRGGRELPIEASFVGKRVEAAPQEIIEVRLREEDDTEKVLLLEKENGRAVAG